MQNSETPSAAIKAYLALGVGDRRAIERLLEPAEKARLKSAAFRENAKKTRTNSPVPDQSKSADPLVELSPWLARHIQALDSERQSASPASCSEAVMVALRELWAARCGRDKTELQRAD